MAGGTVAFGTVTLRDGNCVVLNKATVGIQTFGVSESGKVKIANVSSNQVTLLNIHIQMLQKDDEASNDGYDTLYTFITSTINYRDTSFTFVDADGDSFTVRYWNDTFALREVKLDVFDGQIVLRVEAA